MDADRTLASRALAALEERWWTEATDGEILSLSPFAYQSGISADNLAANNMLRETEIPEGSGTDRAAAEAQPPARRLRRPAGHGQSRRAVRVSHDCPRRVAV